MSDEYLVRIGVPRAAAATNYDDLLSLGAEADECDDDGMVVYTVPRDQDCSWNEGRCPCGGTMRWAEAGYVPWYRICDMCGSAWDLHVVTAYLERRGVSWEPARWELAADQDNEVAPMPSIALPDPSDVVSYRRRVMEMMRASVAARAPDQDEIRHCGIYGSWAQSARLFPR